ncbi:ABC transporter substrate-binding protein [Candidatus Saccharibacteria bacterium]|nr:ABC transporter substrate-binding protein [Candidatus Saccharibacteria bacterium]
MASSIKKRGQKIIRKFSRVSIKASEEGKEHIKENLFQRLSHIGNIKLLIFEWGLLIFALIMLSVAQAFWFGDSYAENTFVSGGTYTEATIGNVNSLNPLFATTDSEKVLSKLLFATLITNDYSGHANIGLAESIKASNDGKVWTIKLRDNLKWSDGEPITNADVLFTTNIIKNSAVNTIYDANLSSVKVAENEEGEIVFTLPAPYADFISALNIPIIPEHILGDADPKTLIENGFSTSPITSGAFSFNAIQTTSASDETIVYLSANPNYYLGSPMLNSFAVHTYTDRDGVLGAINSGSVTATAELSETDADKISAGQYYQKNSSLNSGAFVFFNTAKPNMKKALRLAIRQGINLARIREQAEGTVALDYPLTESQIKLSSYPAIPSYDQEAAKAKVAELSGDTPIHLEIATINSGYLPIITESIKEDLESLGLEVNVSYYEENQEFITNIISKKDYDILIYETELGADPDLLPYYHSSQASSSGLNLSNYKNNLVDDLLIGARETTEEELRVKKYESFLEYWVNDVPAVALYQPNLTYYYNKNVRSFGNDVRLVTALDRFTDITNWAVSTATKNKTP